MSSTADIALALVALPELLFACCDIPISMYTVKGCNLKLFLPWQQRLSNTLVLMQRRMKHSGASPSALAPQSSHWLSAELQQCTQRAQPLLTLLWPLCAVH
jgi:hypothetical protein